MDKNCKDCKYYEEYICDDKVMKCRLHNKYYTGLLPCTSLQEKPELYTTGQMIDMLMQDSTLEAKFFEGGVTHIIKYKQAGYFEGLGKYYDFRQHRPTDRWKVYKPQPKRTYKDVLLEKFPKTKLDGNGYPDICMETLFGIMDCGGIKCGECWNKEYPFSEGEEAKQC